MNLKAYWAYAFTCDHALEAMHDLLNGAGPWQWSLRDSHWYGDYLNCRPVEGVRVRIHEWEDAAYTVLLQIEAGSAAQQDAVDQIVKTLLGRLEARSIVEEEPYD